MPAPPVTTAAKDSSRVNAFRLAVYEEGGDIANSAVTQAIERFVAGGRISRDDVGDCIEFAARHGTLNERPLMEHAPLRRGARTPTTQLIQQMTVAALEPIVRELRRDIWGARRRLLPPRMKPRRGSTATRCHRQKPTVSRRIGGQGNCRQRSLLRNTGRFRISRP